MEPPSRGKWSDPHRWLLRHTHREGPGFLFHATRSGHPIGRGRPEGLPVVRFRAAALEEGVLAALEDADVGLSRCSAWYSYHLLHGVLDWRTPAERDERTVFMDGGLEPVHGPAQRYDRPADLMAPGSPRLHEPRQRPLVGALSHGPQGPKRGAGSPRRRRGPFRPEPTGTTVPMPAPASSDMLHPEASVRRLVRAPGWWRKRDGRERSSSATTPAHHSPRAMPRTMDGARGSSARS